MKLKENLNMASDSVLQGKLALVNRKVPQTAIQTWTLQQRYDAQDWAERTHLRASDNILKVPAEPAFLKKFPEINL